MNLIETYNGSGFYAQYAESAVYDANGTPLTSYLTAVPDTYLQNTDLSTEDGKVTAISGIPLSAGGDVPEGVMVESGLEYNAVNEISAYNGSAIAQYGAEKQWLVHDDTLVHAANSAQYALGVNLSAVAQLLGVDETVLYSASANTNNTAGQVFEMAESVMNFDRIRITCDNMEFPNRPFTQEYKILTSSCSFNSPMFNGNIPPSVNIPFVRYTINSSGNLVCFSRGLIYNIWTEPQVTTGDNRGYCLREVIGIGRKS